MGGGGGGGGAASSSHSGHGNSPRLQPDQRRLGFLWLLRLNQQFLPHFRFGQKLLSLNLSLNLSLSLNRTHRQPVGEVLVGGLRDAAHRRDIRRLPEGLLLPVVHDARRERRADAGQRLQFLGRRRVQVHERRLGPAPA